MRILEAAEGEEKSELRDLSTDRGVAVDEDDDEGCCFLSVRTEEGVGAGARRNEVKVEEEEAVGVSGATGVEGFECWILGFLGVGPSRWFSEKGWAWESTEEFSFPSIRQGWGAVKEQKELRNEEKK